MTRSRSFDRDGTCSQREAPSKRSEIGKRSAESRIANPNPRKASAEEDEKEKDRKNQIQSNQIKSNPFSGRRRSEQFMLADRGSQGGMILDRDN